MLTDAAREQIARRDAERQDRWEGRRPIVDSRLGARTLGDMAIVEPGCELYAKPGVEGVARVGDDGGDLDHEGCQPRGGIVLEIVDAPHIDADTGEIRLRRAFRCFDYTPGVPLWQATVTLTEAQVDPASFAPVNPMRVRAAWRRCCRWVGEQKATASTRELAMGAVIFQLMAIVGRTQ